MSLLSACAQPPVSETPPEAPPVEEPTTTGVPIIFDTDLGYDCDDAGALAVLHALADKGEAELLATITVVSDPYSAGALDVINTYYGRPDLPVGAYQGERWREAWPYWLAPETRFLEPLVTNYESDIETNAQAEEAGALYRKTLALRPDKSVTVVTVGFLQNLADLLRSPGDAHSPLTGRNLVAQKVEKLVVMGGRYPSSPDQKEFNLGAGPYEDGSAAQAVVQTWPTPIVFSGSEIGGEIRTGGPLRDMLPENPVALAYDLFPGTDAQGERQSWDLTAVLYAVRGEGALWSLREDEHIVVRENGSHVWQARGVSPARLSLKQEASVEEVEAVLNDLLAQPPQQGTGTESGGAAQTNAKQ